MTKIEVCKRDKTNNWVRSKKADGFVCLRCVVDGIWNKEIRSEIEKVYPKEFNGGNSGNRYLQKGK